jgi:hypothetical protein
LLVVPSLIIFPMRDSDFLIASRRRCEHTRRHCGAPTWSTGTWRTARNIYNRRATRSDATTMAQRPAASCTAWRGARSSQHGRAPATCARPLWRSHAATRRTRTCTAWRHWAGRAARGPKYSAQPHAACNARGSRATCGLGPHCGASRVRAWARGWRRCSAQRHRSRRRFALRYSAPAESSRRRPSRMLYVTCCMPGDCCSSYVVCCLCARQPTNPSTFGIRTQTQRKEWRWK